MINAKLLELARRRGTDSDYLDWVRTMPSCVTDSYGEWVDGIGRNEACHVRRSHNSGTSIKPEYSAIPMTHDEHALQHQRGESVFGAPEWYDEQVVHHLVLWINGKVAIGSQDSEHWSRVYIIKNAGILVGIWLLLKKYFQKKDARPVKVIIQPNYRQRSVQQNRAQWGLMYKTMVDYYADHPSDLALDALESIKFGVDASFIHEMCKRLFNDGKSTARLSTVQSNEYASRVREFFLHKYNIDIPEPVQESHYQNYH